jgi:hypothetical protein
MLHVGDTEKGSVRVPGNTSTPTQNGAEPDPRDDRQNTSPASLPATFPDLDEPF